VKSTYRLRSRRSSEFPVINYRVDDRVPSLFLPLAPPLLSALLFLIRLPFLPCFSTVPFARPPACPLPSTMDSFSFPSLPCSRLSLLSPSFFFIHLTASRKRYTAYRSSVRTTCGPPFIKLSILDTCTARARLSEPSWNEWARVASTISPADFKL